MKTIPLTILLVAFAGLISRAQPVLRFDNQGMRPGDYHETIFTRYAKPGPAGEKQVWDFSQVSLINKHHSRVLHADETPHADKFPEANAAIHEHGNYFYFDMQPDGTQYWGYMRKNLVVKYDKPSQRMQYPFRYGDAFSGDYTAQTIISTLYGRYQVTADAYGTLKLPGGQVFRNVLRVHSVEDYVEEACNSVKAHTVKYSWYHPDYRYPLYVMFYRTEHYLGREKPKVYEYGILNQQVLNKELLTHTADETADPHYYELFPNPFVEYTTLQYYLTRPAEVSLELFDMQGHSIARPVWQQEQAQGSYSQEISADEYALTPGSYLLKIVLGKQVFLETLVIPD